MFGYQSNPSEEFDLTKMSWGDHGQSIELNPIENWAYSEGKLAIFKCYQIVVGSEIGVGKCANFKMLKALKKCHKNTSSLKKKQKERLLAIKCSVFV